MDYGALNSRKKFVETSLWADNYEFVDLKEFQAVDSLYFTFMERTRKITLMLLAVKTVGYL
jgi:hypothetical protein